MAEQKKSEKELNLDKYKRVMTTIARRASFYRENPQRFVKEFLNIKLALFQKILIYALMHENYFMYIAARGSGKTWLTALFCVIRCILFPGTKIVIASSCRSQANEVLSKIEDDFMINYGWGSLNLRSEIKIITIGQNKAECKFKNGSYIKVVTASDNARSARANIIIIDEFRMVDLNVINTVLRRFLTAPRRPGYISKPEYADLLERNKEIYMSSAWYQSHWSYDKLKAYFVNMLDDTRKYFCCALPYQLSIKEKMFDRSQIEDEMSEADFDPLKFQMELECLFFGDTDGSFFNYNDVSKCRKLKNSYFSPEIYKNIKDLKIPKLLANERRILSVDIALLSSKNRANDSASLQINNVIKSSQTSYTGNFLYYESHEGMTTDELGLRVMRLFYEYNCTDIAVDIKGLGVGVYDFIIRDQFDPATGVTYKAMTISDKQLRLAGSNRATLEDYASRCKIKNANKVIWGILGSPIFNSDAAKNLRNGFQLNKVNLLVSEFEADEILKTSVKNYIKMNPVDQVNLKASYIHTTASINELLNLEYEATGNTVRVFERSGTRKDRYSSMSYNYYVQCQLERLLKPEKSEIEKIILGNTLPIRTVKRYKMFD